jgi:hypothetical protein
MEIGFFLWIPCHHSLEVGFKSIMRGEARGACIERFRKMDIKLDWRENQHGDQDLGGFIKFHLHSLHKDDIALLKRGRAFVMKMEDDEERIDKVEKGFELITKARILYFHLKEDTLLGQPCTHHFPRDSHGELLQKGIT